MVTVESVVERTNSATGELFCSVMVVGTPTVYTNEDGKTSIVALKASAPSNLPKSMLMDLVGKQLPGTVIRVETDPYTWVNPRTGEELTLSHTYKYVGEEPELV